MNKETIKKLREHADELISAGVANKDVLVAGIVVGGICGCSIFGPGIGASVY